MKKLPLSEWSWDYMLLHSKPMILDHLPYFHYFHSLPQPNLKPLILPTLCDEMYFKE